MLILFGLLLLLLTVILCFVFCILTLISLIRKKPFPKKLGVTILIGFLMVGAIYVYDVYFFTFDRIDRTYMQEGPQKVVSPNKEYTASAYYELYGGAAGGVNVWVEVESIEEKTSKIIYYADAKDQFSLSWKDDTTLFIQNNQSNYPDSNRSIALHIDNEIYHEFGRACRSLLMKNEYERCYSN